MAYTAVITKESVSKLNEDDYQVSIHAKITDETSEVILEGDYSERYNSTTSVDTIKTKLQTQISTDWDKLIAEGVIFNAAAFGTMVSEIQTAANTYING